ncbi:N-acetyltransferase [Marinobacteraceae bacterium S3BR75-40.1]
MQFSPISDTWKSQIPPLFLKTFSDAEGPSEGTLVSHLVTGLINHPQSGDIRGFVAVENQTLAGCIFFTRLTFESRVNVFLLSPVAVHTDYQGRGIGQQLIRYGIEQLRETGVQRIFTYGDPAFYSKVGFRQVTEQEAQPPFPLAQPEGWLCLAVDGSELAPLPGVARCVSAFNDPAYW